MDHCFARDVFSAAAMVTSISISALLPPKRRAHIQHKWEFGVWRGWKSGSHAQAALKGYGEHVPSQGLVVMCPNSRNVPREARREKNTPLAESHQHQLAGRRADGNTCCATPVASLRKAWNGKTTGLVTWAILHPLKFLCLIVLVCPFWGQYLVIFSPCSLSALKKKFHLFPAVSESI